MLSLAGGAAAEDATLDKHYQAEGTGRKSGQEGGEGHWRWLRTRHNQEGGRVNLFSLKAWVCGSACAAFLLAEARQKRRLISRKKVKKRLDIVKAQKPDQIKEKALEAFLALGGATKPDPALV